MIRGSAGDTQGERLGELTHGHYEDDNVVCSLMGLIELEY
jgi:hypothetical protein